MTEVPYSETLEQAVLGGIFHDARLFADVSAWLAPGDMFLLRHRMIFEALLRLSERGDDLNLTNCADELRALRRLDDVGGTAYLSQLVGSTPEISATENFARKLADYAYRRRLLKAGDDVKALAVDLSVDAGELRAEVENRIAGADSANHHSDVTSLFEEMGRYFDGVEQTQGQMARYTGLATGFDDYDELIDGLQAGSLNYVAARPGMGKSSLLLCIALHVALQGLGVYFWSGEMPKKQLLQRLMSIRSGIRGRLLQRGLRPGGLNSRDWRRFVDESGRTAELPIFLDDSDDITPALLKARVTHLARRADLGLIIVDYVGLMEAGFHKENRTRELGYISRKLKQLAKIAPVLAASQLNRNLESRQDKHPTLADLRDSGDLEQDADTVTFIYRPVVYNSDTPTPNRADLIVAKNRHGETGTAILHFDPLLTKFSNATFETVKVSGYERENGRGKMDRVGETQSKDD